MLSLIARRFERLVDPYPAARPPDVAPLLATSYSSSPPGPYTKRVLSPPAIFMLRWFRPLKRYSPVVPPLLDAQLTLPL